MRRDCVQEMADIHDSSTNFHIAFIGGSSCDGTMVENSSFITKKQQSKGGFIVYMNMFITRQRVLVAKCTSHIALLLLIFSGCGSTPTPSPSDRANVQIFSEHRMMIQTYEIPESIFRGVIWPSPSNQGFTLWLITGSTEHFVTIPTPSEVIEWQEDVTDTWTIHPLQETRERTVYAVASGDKIISAHIDLPNSTKGFTFSVLTNASHDHILVFMDISESVIDTGIFGYIVISHHQ